MPALRDPSGPYNPHDEIAGDRRWWALAVLGIGLAMVLAAVIWHRLQTDDEVTIVAAQPYKRAPTPEELRGATQPSDSTADLAVLGANFEGALGENVEPPPQPLGPDPVDLLTPPSATISGDASAPPSTPSAPPVPSIPFVPGGPFLVQIGAVREDVQVDPTVDAARKKAQNLLEGAIIDVARVDLGPEKGVWRRIRVDGFEARAAASAFCDQLRAQSVDCLVVVR